MVDLCTKLRFFLLSIVKSEEMPLSFQSMKSALNDQDCRPNIKLLILKIITECRDIFKPYAKHFIGDILRIILSPDTWPKGSPIINYFSLDILAMLSGWQEIPNNDIVEKSLSSACIQKLAEAAMNAPSREIMRYILELSTQLIEHWRY